MSDTSTKQENQHLSFPAVTQLGRLEIKLLSVGVKHYNGFVNFYAESPSTGNKGEKLRNMLEMCHRQLLMTGKINCSQQRISQLSKPMLNHKASQKDT